MVKVVKGQLQLVLLTLACLASLPAAADPTEILVTVDKNPVVVNESVVLNVEVDDNIDRSLYRPDQFFDDFIVGRTSTSAKTSIVNGRRQATTTFRTVLTPQRAGSFTIPIIEMAGVRSNPVQLRVVAEGDPDASGVQRTAFLTATIDSEEVYLQQQFTYVAKLYLAADLSGGNITPPQLDGADIVQVGQDQESTEMINGRRYRVYQRNFSVTPNRSGEFEIDGAVFDGEVYQDRSNSMFSSFASTSPITAKAPTVNLKVRPIPRDWQGDWLPSELVSLSREFSPASSSVDIGEPITVTYMLTAVNVKPEQLPELKLSDLPNVRSYPEQPNIDSFTRNGVSIAQLTQQVTLIANAPGELEIPLQRLPWFNTKTGLASFVEVPAKRITITGIAGQQAELPDAASQQQAESGQAAAEDADTAVPDAATSSRQTDTPWSFLWIGLTVLFLGLWLITLTAWWWARRRTNNQPRVQHTKEVPADVEMKRHWQAFQLACKNNQAEAAAVNLQRWSNHYFDQPLHSLKELAGRLSSPELKQQIDALQASRYAADKHAWTAGKALYQSLHKALQADRQRRSTRQKKAADDLPSLYSR